MPRNFFERTELLWTLNAHWDDVLKKACPSALQAQMSKQPITALLEISRQTKARQGPTFSEKIKTARPETSYAVLPTRTVTVNWIKCFSYITVSWGTLINATYVFIRHIRTHSISHKYWKVHTTTHSKRNLKSHLLNINSSEFSF